MLALVNPALWVSELFVAPLGFITFGWAPCATARSRRAKASCSSRSAADTSADWTLSACASLINYWAVRQNSKHTAAYRSFWMPLARNELEQRSVPAACSNFPMRAFSPALALLRLFIAPDAGIVAPSTAVVAPGAVTCWESWIPDGRAAGSACWWFLAKWWPAPVAVCPSWRPKAPPKAAPVAVPGAVWLF